MGCGSSRWRSETDYVDSTSGNKAVKDAKTRALKKQNSKSTSRSDDRTVLLEDGQEAPDGDDGKAADDDQYPPAEAKYPNNDEYSWLVLAVLHFRDVVTSIYDDESANRVEGLCKDCDKMTVGKLLILSFGQLSPPEYVDKLKKWTNKKLLNELPDNAADPNFKQLIRKIVRRIFRVWGHIYVKHGKQVDNSGQGDRLRNEFKFMVSFGLQYGLIKTKNPELDHLTQRIQQVQQWMKEMKSSDPYLLTFFGQYLEQDKPTLEKFKQKKKQKAAGN